jgi:hypothetical protein
VPHGLARSSFNVALGEPVVYVDGTQAADVDQLTRLVEYELAGATGGAREDLDRRPGWTSLRLVERLRALRELPATVILVDCTRAAAAAHVLFGQLRDELWQLEHRWVVAVEDAERSLLGLACPRSVCARSPRPRRARAQRCRRRATG